MSWETRTSSSRIHDTYMTKQLGHHSVGCGYGCMYAVVLFLMGVGVVVLRMLGVL